MWEIDEMNKEIETDKWRILFKHPVNEGLDESYIELVFRLKFDISGIKSIKKRT